MHDLGFFGAVVLDAYVLARHVVDDRVDVGAEGEEEESKAVF